MRLSQKGVRNRNYSAYVDKCCKIQNANGAHIRQLKSQQYLVSNAILEKEVVTSLEEH